MFTKKDRKIANLKVMIKNRDGIIDELNRENKIIREANKDLRFENEELTHNAKKELATDRKSEN